MQFKNISLLVLSCVALFVALARTFTDAAVTKRSERSLAEKKARVASLMEQKNNYWDAHRSSVKRVPSSRGNKAAVKCVNGAAVVDGEAYPCRNVDFFSLLSVDDLHITRPNFPNDLENTDMADVWGWLSPSGREITLACMTTGLRIVDGTDPLNPIDLGYIASNRVESYWCDVKVYRDTAYIVKDRLRSQPLEPENGIQVFNLLRLEEFTTEDSDREFLPDLIYTGHGNSHNVVVNTETGFIYTVGNQGDDCASGLHMVDVNEPLNPVFAGCAAEDGYIHDAQCVIYTGPDASFQGHELCFGYNEDSLTIYDVTDKSNVVIISITPYETSGYTHQGWLNSEMDIVFLDDELDELDGGQPNTRTFIFDVSDLAAPVLTGIYKHPSPSIDHNLYIWGAIHANGWGGSPAMENPPNDKIMYHANYESGLRVVDITGAKEAPPSLREVGFFDVAPDRESADWFGSWSTYMHPSGVIAITSIERGLFFVNFTYAFSDPSVIPDPTSAPTTGPPSFVITKTPTNSNSGGEDDGIDIPESTLLLALVVMMGVVAVLVLVILVLLYRGGAAATSAVSRNSIRSSEIVGQETKLASPHYVQA